MNVKFCTKRIINRRQNSVLNTLNVLNITKMATVWFFEVKSANFNAPGAYVSGNNAKK
jgi:hypothetical protein